MRSLDKIKQQPATAIGLLLLIIPLITSVVYAVILPISFDEGTTFLLFTRNGIIESTTTYAAPNNHILHSVLTNLTKYLPGFSDLFKLRITSIVVNILAQFVLFRCITKHFGLKMGILVMAVSSMLFMTVYYSYMSRGYALLNLFFILALYASFDIIKGENPQKKWLLFSLASVLGFYTMPSFLYPFLTLNVLILVLHPKSIVQQFKAGLLTFLSVALLYAPIICHQGVTALIANPYVRPIGFVAAAQGLPAFYLKLLEEISGFHWAIMAVLLALSAYLIFKSGEKKTKWIAFIFIAAPVVLLCLHGVIPFKRIFFFYNSIIILLLCLPLKNRMERFTVRNFTALALVLQVLLLLNFERKIYAYEDHDGTLNITADKIIHQIIGNKKYFFNGTLLACNLEFNLITKGYKNYQIKEDVYTKHSSADTIHGFDYVIIDQLRDQTIKRKPFIRTDYYNIYKE